MLRETAPNIIPITRVICRRFELIELLGSGRTGTVYRANDRALGNEEVVVKLLSPELSADRHVFAGLKREALAARALTHPGIAKVFEVGVSCGTPFLVREYVDGAPLMVWRQTAEPSAAGWNRIAAVLKQIAEAIEYAHAHSILHRAIEPDNILVTEDDRTYLLDFGLAKALDRASERTRTGEALGMPELLAPELFRAGSATAASDIYSFGMLVFMLAAGRLPYDGESYLRIAERKLQGDPFEIRNYEPLAPAWVDELIRACCASDPSSRIATPSALIPAATPKLETRIHAARLQRRFSRHNLRGALFRSSAIAASFLCAAVLVTKLDPECWKATANAAIRLDTLLSRQSSHTFLRMVGAPLDPSPLENLIRLISKEPDAWSRIEVETLLRSGAVDPNSRDSEGEPLTIRVLRSATGVTTWLPLLLQYGADPDASGTAGMPPLHLATSLRAPGAVSVLLRGGANPTTLDNEGRTFIHISIEARDTVNAVNSIATLRAHSPASVAKLIDRKGDWILHTAADLSYSGISNTVVEQTLVKGQKSACIRDKRGRTPLMRAAISRNISVLDALLLKNASCIGAADSDGMTALMYAARAGNGDSIATEIMRTLIARGHPLGSRDKSMRTAQDWARLGGFQEGLALLSYLGTHGGTPPTAPASGSSDSSSATFNIGPHI